jgi:prepilin-type N-terminal cleavage/methylation domain-containing protein
MNGHRAPAGRHGRNAGFTLIEVLLALAILTIVILTSLAVFLERNKRLQQASDLIRAYQSLANEAEMQRHVPYGMLKTKADFLSDTAVKADFLSDTAVLAPLAPYTTDVEVVQKSPGVKRVSLIIRWKRGQTEAKLDILRTDTGGANLW